jgi:pimeloyl-ACP methyl ester carboxylesterase
MLIQPKRFIYSSAELAACSDDGTDISIKEFEMNHNGVQLHAAQWNVEPHSKVCVVYLHTNTRSLLDAKEILPFCSKLGANLVAFDLPGCGKSSGTMSFHMSEDLNFVLSYVKDVLGFSEIVLWARGMATAVAVESVSRLLPDSTVKFIVMDTPFTSVRSMVENGCCSVKACGITVPKYIVRLSGKVIRRSVKARLGSDPYDVMPMNLVGNAGIPAFVLSAENDDYIPLSHGRAIAEGWGATRGQNEEIKSEAASGGSVKCFLLEFDGRHFGERPERVVCTPVDEVLPYLSKREEDASATVLSNLIRSGSFPLLASAATGSGGGMIRSRSSLAMKGLC